MLRSLARSLSVVIALVGGVAFVGTANAAPAHKAAKHHHKKAKARKAHHKHSRKKAAKLVESPRPMP